MSRHNKVQVTLPFLPPLDEFLPYLEKIWATHQLTNKGPFHEELEKELCNYLGVENISLFCNGTIALQIAMKTLEIKGEIITTPYTFVATAHAIKWNDAKPVFVDIEQETCNIDPDKIEEAITKKTTAILPVHVYGYPCNLKKINKIAKKYNLKVIYDAAHAFAVKINGESILNAGDLSVLSFHATKVFNTFEGGAIVSHTPEMKKKIDDLKNFGFQNETTVKGLGINGKMNEIQASMGLLQLKYIDNIILKRKEIIHSYRTLLANISGLKYFEDLVNVNHNYSYFPVFIDENKYRKSRDELYDYLKYNNIFGRRYFYPIITKFEEYRNLQSASKNNLNVSNKHSKQVICLPIFPDLSGEKVQHICQLIDQFQNN